MHTIPHRYHKSHKQHVQECAEWPTKYQIMNHVTLEFHKTQPNTLTTQFFVNLGPRVTRIHLNILQQTAARVVAASHTERSLDRERILIPVQIPVL